MWTKAPGVSQKELNGIEPHGQRPRQVYTGLEPGVVRSKGDVIMSFRNPASLVLLSFVAAVPSSAQMDFSGDWAPRFYEDQPERVPGPELGDYLGLPINAAARMRADTWSASLLTLPEWQCRPHGADYIWRGPSNLRIWKEVDPVSREIVAWHAEWLRSVDRPVYMDGRPHPPEYAPHTWAGFSTGKYEGDVLTTTVTHLKESYIRRNGMARSEKATVTEHWIRHGDWLTVVTDRQRSRISDRTVRAQHRL